MNKLNLAVNGPPKRGRPKKNADLAELQKVIDVAIAKPFAQLATNVERALKLVMDQQLKQSERAVTQPIQTEAVYQ